MIKTVMVIFFLSVDYSSAAAGCLLKVESGHGGTSGEADDRVDD
jgi:hypothetical protein